MGVLYVCLHVCACMQAPDLGQTLLRFQGNTMQAMYRGIARALAETCDPGVRDLRRPQVRFPMLALMHGLAPHSPTTKLTPHTSGCMPRLQTSSQLRPLRSARNRRCRSSQDYLVFLTLGRREPHGGGRDQTSIQESPLDHADAFNSHNFVDRRTSTDNSESSYARNV